jgi:hypothetical protein
MSSWHVISAHVKPQSGGRSQNYMPPEAADALKKAATAKSAAASSPEYPVAK